MTKKAKPDTSTYGVVGHVIDLPGGHVGAPGMHVELTDADAAPLLADGHLVPIVPNLSETK